MSRTLDFDANCTQKEVTDISAHSIKPSEPSGSSVIYVGKQKDIPSRFFLTQLMKSLLDCSVLSSNQNVMVTGDNR